jgi:hypothetical protein
MSEEEAANSTCLGSSVNSAVQFWTPAALATKPLLRYYTVWSLVHKRTIPTERPSFVDQI